MELIFILKAHIYYTCIGYHIPNYNQNVSQESYFTFILILMMIAGHYFRISRKVKFGEFLNH